MLSIILFSMFIVSTHSRPKAAAATGNYNWGNMQMFQHTAARRRLLSFFNDKIDNRSVSTHSRPKAAAGGKTQITEKLK